MFVQIQESLSSAVPRVEIQQPPLEEIPAPQHRPSELTPEQLQALENAFAQSDEESRFVLGLLGMWTGTLVLHDVLKETVSSASTEQDDKKPKRPDDGDPQPS